MLPEGTARVPVSGLPREKPGAVMERSEPDAADDNAMDSFLDKFQSQPYRGGFREDRWEEVGDPGFCTCMGCSPGRRGLPDSG